MDEQPPLFDLPESLRRKPRMAAQSSVVRYTKYKPKDRILCQDCIRDIHARGIAVAPVPSSVRWRRSKNGEVDLLCERHKFERVERGD